MTVPHLHFSLLPIGTEFFAGISNRTNIEGIDSLQAAFPNYPVIYVDVNELQEGLGVEDQILYQPLLHLKSFTSVCGNGRLLAGGPVGQRFVEYLQKRDKYAETGSKPTCGTKYEVVHVPDVEAANCLFINGTIVRRATSEFPRSGHVFETELKDTPQIEVVCSELTKMDGAISCCSLLLSV